MSDNLFPHDVAAISALVMRASDSQDQLAQTLADRLVVYATQCMWDKKRVSPFEGQSLCLIACIKLIKP